MALSKLIDQTQIPLFDPSDVKLSRKNARNFSADAVVLKRLNLKLKELTVMFSQVPNARFIRTV